MRKYVIMGIQGSGKGTQAKLLAADFDLVHISVGDIFRWNVQHHTKLGAQVRRIVAAGELVDDDLVEAVVRERLQRARLELRLHRRRLPPQPPPGRVLPRELRHRRGDPARAARRARCGERVLARRLCSRVRARLQPHRPPAGRRPTSATSAAASWSRARTTTRRRSRPACATTTTRPGRSWSCSAQGGHCGGGCDRPGETGPGGHPGAAGGRESSVRPSHGAPCPPITQAFSTLAGTAWRPASRSRLVCPPGQGRAPTGDPRRRRSSRGFRISITTSSGRSRVLDQLTTASPGIASAGGAACAPAAA